MADCICHIEVKTISRSAGRSATGAAAYRGGEKIKDERTGETFDYTHKAGVLHHENVLPKNVTLGYTTEELWNAAELAEKRANSTVAREYIIALPHELTPDERQKLAVDFASSLVETYGVAASVAIHAPSKGGDERNHHAHILTSTRVLTASGFGAKTRILDDRKTGPDEVLKIREAWAGMANAYLARAESERRMDARSFVGRGIGRVPEVHLGPAAAAIERRHDRWKAAGGVGEEPPTSERGDRNREIRALNALAAERDKLKARLEAEPETMEEARQRLIAKLREDFKARGIGESFWARLMRDEIHDLENSWCSREEPGAEHAAPKYRVGDTVYLKGDGRPYHVTSAGPNDVSLFDSEANGGLGGFRELRAGALEHLLREVVVREDTPEGKAERQKAEEESRAEREWRENYEALKKAKAEREANAAASAETTAPIGADESSGITATPEAGVRSEWNGNPTAAPDSSVAATGRVSLAWDAKPTGAKPVAPIGDDGWESPAPAQTTESMLEALWERKTGLERELSREAERLASPGIKRLEMSAEAERKILESDRAGVAQLLAKLEDEHGRLKDPDLLDRAPLIGGLLRLAGWNNIANNADWEHRYEAAKARDAEIGGAMGKLGRKLAADIEAERAKARKDAERLNPDTVERARETEGMIAEAEERVRRAKREARLYGDGTRKGTVRGVREAGGRAYVTVELSSWQGADKAEYEIPKRSAQTFRAGAGHEIEFTTKGRLITKARDLSAERERGRGKGMSR